MLSIKDNARTFIDLSCYAGPGLSVVGPEESVAAYGGAIHRSRRLLRDLCFFDRCYLVVGDYSELIGLNFFLGRGLTTLLESGHLKLLRLAHFPSFSISASNRPEAYRGVVMKGIIRYPWMTGDDARINPDRLYDHMISRFHVPGEFDHSLRAAKRAALENTLELSPKYASLGDLAIQEMCTHMNKWKKPPRPVTPEYLTAYLTAELQEQQIGDFPISYYSELRPNWPTAVTAFESQFLFNLSIEIARMCEATDFQIADPYCAEIKMAALDNSEREIGPVTVGDSQSDPFRLLRLNGVPDVADVLRLDYGKASQFVDTVCSPRAEAFRAWFHENAGNEPDDIIAAYMRLLSSASLLEQSPGKIMRYLIAGAAGFVPVIGPALGLALSAVDSFLLERLVSPKKPKIFVEELKQVLS